MKKYRIISNSNNHGFKIEEIVEGEDKGWNYMQTVPYGLVFMSDIEEIPEPQPTYRLFNAATDSLEDLSKLNVNGRKVVCAVKRKDSKIAYMTEDGDSRAVDLYGKYMPYDRPYAFDLMIEIHAPVEVKQYQNQYKDKRGSFWHESIQNAVIERRCDISDRTVQGMAERTLIDGKLVSIRLLSTEEYENI